MLYEPNYSLCGVHVPYAFWAKVTLDCFFRWTRAPLSLAQRKARVKQKKESFLKTLEAEAEGD